MITKHFNRWLSSLDACIRPRGGREVGLCWLAFKAGLFTRWVHGWTVTRCGCRSHRIDEVRYEGEYDHAEDGRDW